MAAELVGGAFLSASIQFLFERLGSPEVLALLRGQSKRCDVNELLGKLKLDLSLVNAVLNDAEQKQTQSQSIEEWLDMLQDVVFDAEDLLDEIESDALQLKVEADQSRANSSKVRKTITKKFCNLFPRSRKRNSNDADTQSKINKILDKLEKIKQQKDFLGLREGVVGERPSWRPLPSTCLVDESGVYGRDDDKKEIIKLLLLSDDVGSEEISVIPIVGMGGVGKTTLAQLVYNDTQVDEYFETKAWVSVSEDFDACRVIKALLQSFSSSSYDEIKELNLLQVKLKESLTGNKFLIVLDDVWNEKYVDWDSMRVPFTYGAQGSKIIVTTRSEVVASIMGTRTIPTHHLEVLKEEACWQLFAKHAFGNEGSNANPNLQRIGRDIVKKCKGLPLAAKTLGGLLRSTLDVTKWERISDSEIWELADEQSNILPALRLSYYYLPSHLKRCFAYCSIFPKDYEFDKENLVLLWMAEDLLGHPKTGKRIEQVGDEYFDDLVCRSFFQRSGANKSLFIMHDLMNDLAKFVSRKYFFRLESGNSNKIEMKTRHLACVMAQEGHDLCESFKSVLEATRLRTFLQLKECGSPCSLLEVVLKLRYLRVLSLPCFLWKELSDPIGELRLLRYLDLSKSLISKLPEFVCKLYHLQTLKLRECWELTELPVDFHRLVNLRYLDVEGCLQLKEMPTQMGKLKSLQRLSTFIVGEDNKSKIGELGELSDLSGKLCIKNIQNVVRAEDALEAKLRDKKYLQELEFEWRFESNVPDHEREVLDNLLPGTTLKRLKITRYGGRKFPNWLGDHLFRNIVDINLSDCKCCDSLPPLGQLSSLKSLEISEFDAVVRVGSEFYGDSSSFVSLETLKFEWMPNWEEWSIPVDGVQAFPKLRELSIVRCEKLTGDLPMFLPSLTSLTIIRCPELASLLPMMPEVNKLILVNCDRLSGGYHVVKTSGCLQHLEISKSLDSTTCTSLPATLKTLTFRGCKNLEFPPLHSYPCPDLTELHIKFCHVIVTSGMSWDSQQLPNLTRFEMWSCTFENNLESFPEEGLLPTTITELVINGFESFKTLDSNGLQQLTSLKSLVIHHGSYLQTINVEEALPSSLEHLSISFCPLLEKKCEREKGEYWNKISHIPKIYINHRLIS